MNRYLEKIAKERPEVIPEGTQYGFPQGDFEGILVHQFHQAEKAGDHTDWRIVIGDKAFSWATKKGTPAPGGKIVLWEQPVHTKDYALSPEVHHPEGTYGAGVSKQVYKSDVKGTIHSKTFKFSTSDGQKFTIHKLESFGPNAWLLMNMSHKQ